MTRDCVHLYTGPNQRVRRPRKVWEDAHGKIPQGEVIWHVDGDKDNDDIENLECISRAMMEKRNNPKVMKRNNRRTYNSGYMTGNNIKHKTKQE